MGARQDGELVPGTRAKEPALDAGHMSSGSTQSPATSTTVSGRNSPWTDGDQVPRHQKPMLIMNIEIGDGRTGRLDISQGDDCDELAARFCETHNLPAQRVLKQLSQHIARCMAEKRMLPALSPEESSEEDDEPAVQESERDGGGAQDTTIAVENARALSHSSRAWETKDSRARALVVQQPADSLVTITSGPGSSPGAARGRAAQVETKPGPENSKSGSTFATLDSRQSVPGAALSPRAELGRAASVERAQNSHERLYRRGMMLMEDRKRRGEEDAKSSRSSSVGRRRPDSHERLYQRGMMMIEDRKKRIEEEEQSSRRESVGKQRPVRSAGLMPGRHMRARARSAPRQRDVLDDSDNQGISCAVTPDPKPQERVRSASGSRSLRASVSPADLRAKSEPRERLSHKDEGEPQIPVYERLFSLACYNSAVKESSRTGVCVKTPWTPAGTHHERADRQRVRCSASRISSMSKHSCMSRSSEGGWEESIHERLFQESRVKMTELQEKEEAKRKEQEEQDRQSTRRSRLISARSEELLAESGKDGSAGCIFDKLYEEGIEKGKEIKRLQEEKVKAREAEALQERESVFMPGKMVKPFQPDLGKAARAIKRYTAWEDRIDSLVEQKRQQDEANKLEAELYEISKCTFCPQISKFAAQLKRDLPESNSIHDALYEEAKVWRQKQENPCSPVKNVKRVTKEEEEVVLLWLALMCSACFAYSSSFTTL
jgi:hypothetical protein